MIPNSLCLLGVLRSIIFRPLGPWTITHNIWLTASHIPGINNTAADAESRKTRRETEWSLNPIVFHKAIAEIYFQPDIDLFASRLNYKCKRYVTYQPDPESYAVNAFHIQWTNFSFYAFPPFCTIQKLLKKVQEDKATGLLVVPHWPIQPWWPYRRPVSSVGRASDYRAGGLGFEPQTGPTLGVLK